MIVYLHEGLDHLKGASVAQEKNQLCSPKDQIKDIEWCDQLAREQSGNATCKWRNFAHDHTRQEKIYTIQVNQLIIKKVL